MLIIPQGSSAPRQESPALLTDLQSEVSTEAAPLLEFILRHAAKIVGVLVLFALVLASAAVYNWYMSREADQARAALARLVTTTQGQDRVKALEAFVPGAPQSIRRAALLELGQAALRVGDFDKAASFYEQLAEADQGGALGLLAAFTQATSLNRAGKPAAALAVFEKLESLMPENARHTVRGLLAETALQAGQPQRARTTFEALAAASSGPEAEYFRYRAELLQQPTTSK